MKGELTAIIEPAQEGGEWAICPEVPGALLSPCGAELLQRLHFWGLSITNESRLLSKGSTPPYGAFFRVLFFSSDGNRIDYYI
jgi:hypothetical protein